MENFLESSVIRSLVFLTKVFFSVNEKEEKKYLLFDDDQSYFVFWINIRRYSLHIVEKREIHSHRKILREINFFSKIVAFTRNFCSKSVRVNCRNLKTVFCIVHNRGSPFYETDGRCTNHKIVEAACLAFSYFQILWSNNVHFMPRHQKKICL